MSLIQSSPSGAPPDAPPHLPLDEPPYAPSDTPPDLPVDTPPGNPLDAGDISRIIEMAWEDRTPFESITVQFGLTEAAVIDLMRRQLKRSSFKMWRERMAGRATKHAALRSPEVTRHRATNTRQA